MHYFLHIFMNFKMYRLCLLLAILVISSVNGLLPVIRYPQVLKSFLDHQIVPDVLSVAPVEYLTVTFPTGVQALEGNELSKTEVAGSLPTLDWDAEVDGYHTLTMIDADAPSRVNPESRSFLHWMVGNIPGTHIAAGDTYANYIYSNPEPGTGLHRYILLIYEQPGVVEFEEDPSEPFEARVNFSPDDFAARYRLGAPVAGNFYQVENNEF